MKKYDIKKSKIHGKGAFTTKDLKKNETVGVGIRLVPIVGSVLMYPSITADLGQWLNHSYAPNCRLQFRKSKKNPTGHHYIIAKCNIPTDTELTLNYQNTPWYIAGPGYDYV